LEEALLNALDVAHTWRQVLVVDFVRYFLTAAPFYLVFWVWRPAVLRRRKLQRHEPGRRQISSEIAYSLATVAIFSGIGLCLLYADQAGLTRIYHRVADRGWPYFGLSLAFAILLHDAYFYWTHRILHWKPLYRRVHSIHHRSTSPTPWAAYAFHPLEALVQAGIYPVIVFLVPMHPAALGLFLLYMIVRNVVGHLGFEIFDTRFAQRWPTRWHTTPTHHDLHHRWGRGNYGLYFTVWDDLFGTTRSDYREAFDGAMTAVEMRSA
jgi:sterol desaturase/sphingolipid hydroxylase (fatty acid hydroxylase superfamily)